MCQCVSSLRTPLFTWRLCTLLCSAPARHRHLYMSVASALSGPGGYGVGSCFGYLCPHTCQAFHLLSPKVALITKLQLSCASVCHPCAHLFLRGGSAHCCAQPQPDIATFTCLWLLPCPAQTPSPGFHP